MNKKNENHNEELLEETVDTAADDSVRQDDAADAVDEAAEKDAARENDALDTELEGILGEDAANPEGSGDDTGDKPDVYKRQARRCPPEANGEIPPARACTAV